MEAATGAARASDQSKPVWNASWAACGGVVARLDGDGFGSLGSGNPAPSIVSGSFLKESSFFCRENIEPSLLQPLRRGEKRLLALNARLRCAGGSSDAMMIVINGERRAFTTVAMRR